MSGTTRESPTAIVLVGGGGTRLGSLTARTPKPLLPVAGRPFLDWLIHSLMRAGLRRFVLAAGFRAETILEYADRKRGEGVDVSVATESRPLGTGGAIVSAVEQSRSSDPMLVTNGDSMIVSDLTDIRAHLDQTTDAVIVATESTSPSRFGSILMNSDGSLAALSEKSAVSELINAGVYMFWRRTIASFPRARPLSLERDVIPYLLARGSRIGVVPLSAPFIDIGVPESFAAAERFVRTHVAASEP